MAWQTTGGTFIAVGKQRFYESRPHPTDPDKMQVRLRSRVQYECRGVTYTYADSLVNANTAAYSNGSKSASFFEIGGGGYIVCAETDLYIGAWTDIAAEEET